MFIRGSKYKATQSSHWGGGEVPARWGSTGGACFFGSFFLPSVVFNSGGEARRWGIPTGGDSIKSGFLAWRGREGRLCYLPRQNSDGVSGLRREVVQ